MHLLRITHPARPGAAADGGNAPAACDGLRTGHRQWRCERGGACNCWQADCASSVVLPVASVLRDLSVRDSCRRVSSTPDRFCVAHWRLLLIGPCWSDADSDWLMTADEEPMGFQGFYFAANRRLALSCHRSIFECKHLPTTSEHFEHMAFTA